MFKIFDIMFLIHCCINCKYLIELNVIFRQCCGRKQIVEKNSPLFQACLSGQGRFGAITKACIQLRSVQPRV
ncbi:hypothetical protein MXD98_16720, partial [Legionella pneumophila]|uniref:hypothetical protein n=1 Tax=Legionella pneumophila TaxID=446 RepID=UPI001FF72B0B|nr:hypothetical protein [Legionella pneumophila]